MLTPIDSGGCSRGTVARVAGAVICTATTVAVSAAVAPSLTACIFPAEVFSEVTASHGLCLVLGSEGLSTAGAAIAAFAGMRLTQEDASFEDSQSWTRYGKVMLCAATAFLCCSAAAGAGCGATTLSMCGGAGGATAGALGGAKLAGTAAGSGCSAGTVAGALGAGSVMLFGKACMGPSDEQNRLLAHTPATYATPSGLPVAQPTMGTPGP